MAFHTHLLRPHLIFAITLVVLNLTQTVSSGISSRHGYTYGDQGYTFRNNQLLEKLDSLKNGRYDFYLDDDCNLVLDVSGYNIWKNSPKSYRENCTCEFDAYGYLRITSKHVPWASNVGVALLGDYVLVLQEDRDVVVYGPSLWSVGRPGFEVSDPVAGDKYVLYSKGKMAKPLKSGEQLKNAEFTLKMQDDCNLVLYQYEEYKVWSTNTAGRGTNCYCNMATNSNLEVRDGDNRRVWATTTYHKTARPGSSQEYVFVLHRDGVMNIYDTPIWRTGTSFPDDHLNITAEAFAESNGIASVV